MLLVDWNFVTTTKQQIVEIDNSCKHYRRVKNDYTIDNIVYMEKMGIYHKIYYKIKDCIE